MSRVRDPFREALEDIRGRAMEGVYTPGGAIVIVEEARRLGLSTTPIREALAWLCGEGLLERAYRAGYLAPRLDAALLRDRFWARSRMLAASLDLTAPLAGAASAPDDRVVAAGAVFDRLVRRTGNRALIDAFRRVDAQLRLLGDAEGRVFPDAEAEAAELGRLAREGGRDRLKAAIEAFHARRIDGAAILLLEAERREPRRPAGTT
jgi:hypothetical protein